MALQIPCNPEYNRFPTSPGVTEGPECLVCNHWENRGKMTACHIDGGPRGFCITTFHGSVSRSSWVYRVASCIVFVYSTFTLPAFRQILHQKSIGVILWLTYFQRSSNSQMPKEMVSFMNHFINVLCLEMQRKKLLTVAGSDLFTPCLCVILSLLNTRISLRIVRLWS